MHSVDLVSLYTYTELAVVPSILDKKIDFSVTCTDAGKKRDVWERRLRPALYTSQDIIKISNRTEEKERSVEANTIAGSAQESF